MRVITMIVIVSILLVISIIDFKIKIIPNQLNVLLFISGIWSGFVFQEVTFLSRFLGVFSVSIPLFILAACAGLLLGGLYGFFLLITKRAKRKDCFALGPFLCIGIAVVFFRYIFMKV